MTYINKYHYDVMTRLTPCPESEYLLHQRNNASGTRKQEQGIQMSIKERPVPSIVSHSQISLQIKQSPINTCYFRSTIKDLRRTTTMVHRNIAPRARPPEIQLIDSQTGWGFVEAKTPLKISHKSYCERTPVSKIPNTSKYILENLHV